MVEFRHVMEHIEVYEDGFQKAGSEIEDAFQTVGVMIRAKIDRLCNENKYEEAKELERALIIINNADYNH